MFLFVLLILSCVYDKSGFLLGIGERTVSVSPYKIMYLVLLFPYVIYFLYKGKISYPVYFDQKLYRLIWIVVLGQTGASLLGSMYTSGRIILSSEIYYLIQRSGALMIPLWALRYRLSPQSVLKWFLAAILVHYLFIVLQIGLPGAYADFVSLVSDPLRLDNALGWMGGSWAFIGLQRTQNYGTFVAAFGLLMLGFTSWKGLGKIHFLIVLLISICSALFNASRSVLIMTGVVLFVFFKQTSIFSKAQTYLYGIVLFIIVVCGYSLMGIQDITVFESINRFMGGEAAGSNVGKLAVIDYSLQLFIQSPIVGWGAQRFADITAPLGNYSFYTSEVHVYLLVVLISSGLVGLMLYFVFSFKIIGSLIRCRDWDYTIVGAMFIGVFIYNFIYDAGGLDIFGCFNGVAAYFALTARKCRSENLEENERILTANSLYKYLER